MMKRLLIALAMAAAVSVAFAKVTHTNDFEASWADLVPSVADEDASELLDHESAPSVAVPYPFSGFGEKYLSLDTGDATLWYTNTTAGNVYFDMAMQFNPSASAPELDDGTKIAFYLNTSSNLVVLAGPLSGEDPTAYETSASLDPEAWGRITISAKLVNGGLVFNAFLNGVQISASGTSDFPCLTSDTTIKTVGFKGSGAIDDFVARTTDPFILNPAATIGGEGYASYNDALVDALADCAADAPVTITIPGETPVSMDGSAAAPYAIPDANALKALAAAVKANPAVRGLSYIQTADITWTSADGAFEGIGVRSSIAFTGTYDGGDHKISGVTLAGGKYMGIFWYVTGATIKNLTVENLGFYGTPTGEYGCAIVGAGYGTLERLAQTATGGFSVTNTHNCAGILVNATDVTTITDCTNAVNLVRLGGDKMGGICCFANNEISFVRCVNTGNYTIANPATVETKPGKNGFAGLLGYCQGSNKTISFKDCVNTGLFVNGLDPEVYDLDDVVHGQFFGVSYYVQRTLVDLGGNAFLLSEGQLIGSTNSKTNEIVGVAVGAPYTITGFEYATVAGDVGMTVTSLAKDTEYLVLRDIAASATPVATLAAANDYIAFNTNGYNFAGTVAGSSTVAVTESTSGSVITFTGVAGVASVNDVAYATFDEAMDAVASAPEGHQYVELLADASVNFDAAGTTLAVKENAHTLTVTTTGDIAVSSTPDPSTGITAYTTADGVAKCNDKWYATFTAAYDATLAALGNAKMVVKITDDFTPAISAPYNHFYSLEFIDARADQTEGLTINLKNAAGTAYMASSRYFFPANATLVLATDFIHANATGIISGGTLEIPEGVTVTINVSPYWAFYKQDGSAGISAIAGTGTILLPNNTFDGSTVSKTMFNNPNRCFPSLLRNNSWQGTLELVGTSDDKVCDLSQVANPGSKIRFNGFTAPTFGDNNSTYAMGIELVGDGLTLTGDYTRNYTFTGSLKGSGSLSVANTKQTSLMFTGDVSSFTGNVAASGTSSAITFGSATIGSGQRIVVGDGESVTNAAGATWSATNVIVSGELVANGTMSATKLWGDSGTGVYRANNSAAAIAVASSWNGTYYANFDSGNVSFAFDVATSASATTVINGANGAFSGYPKSGSPATAPNVAGSVVLNANWTIGNGWATNKNTGASNATTFANLSGGGNLTVNGTASGTDPIYYCITTLDGYTGALGGNRGAFVVGKVNVAEMPAAGALVVKTAIGAYGSINDNVPLYVAGADTGKTLTYDAQGAQGAGLYYIDSTPTDPWNTPASDAGVADSLTLDGLTTESAAVTTVAGFNALVSYITSTLDGVTKPGDMTANQKANAVLCYALNATTIPDAVIESASIDSVVTGANGAMTLTVAIDGVTVGTTVDATLLAAVVSAKGGTQLNSLSAENVTVSGYGAADGKVFVTVTPAVESGDPAPTTFFTSAVITK